MFRRIPPVCLSVVQVPMFLDFVLCTLHSKGQTARRSEQQCDKKNTPLCQEVVPK
jgi:hypothetical protein